MDNLSGITPEEAPLRPNSDPQGRHLPASQRPQVTLTALQRYPVKGFPAQSLVRVLLKVGQGLPSDRRFAIANGERALPAPAQWAPCETFFRLTKNAALPLFEVNFTPDALEIRHPDGEVVRAALDLAPERLWMNQVLARWFPAGPHGLPTLLEARPEVGYWDHADAAVSIINLETVEALSTAAGVELDPLRFRGNLHVRGLPAWGEFAWLGRHLRIGEAELEVLRPIDRCSATSVHPVLGRTDVNVPALLARQAGHLYCGIYARVVRAGRVSLDDVVVDLGPAPEALRQGGTAPTAPAQWPRMGQVARTAQESEAVRSFWIVDPLARAGLRPTLRPGQHLRVHQTGEAGSAWRSYTVSALGANGTLRLSVKKAGGGVVSGWLHDQIRDDDPLLISGPFGEFVLPDEPERTIVLLSAGIGITPTVAMLQQLCAMDAPPPVQVLHVAQKTSDLALWAEVQQFAALLPDVTISLYLDQAGAAECAGVGAQLGRPDWDQLAKTLPLREAEFYLCGPPGFMRVARDVLTRGGVPNARWHQEVFVSPSASSAVPALPPHAGPFRVRFERSGVELTWTPERGTLLDLAEGGGLALPAHCRSGACMTCRQEVTAGTMVHLLEPLTPLAEGQSLLCCAVPTDNMTLDA